MGIERRILIAGAGIAGLAAAVRLARQGNEVDVFDQSPAPQPVGSGLVIQPVGLAALVEIELADKLVALGAPISRLFGVSQPSNKVVLDAQYARKSNSRFGLAVQRAALFELLYEAAKAIGVQIHHNAKVTSAQADGVLCLATGETLKGDLVLDALGARSPLSPDPGVALPYGALWGLFDWPDNAAFSKSMLEQRYRRANKMAGVLPLGSTPSDPRFRVAYFWSMHSDKFKRWRQMSLDDWKAEAEDLWPETRSLLDQIKSHDDLTEAHYRHHTLSQPVNDQLVHIGDSFHATSPQLGQGANMALLDAAALDHALRGSSDLDVALRQFFNKRRLHIRVYQTASRLFTPVYQSDSTVLPLIRDQIVAPLTRIWPGKAIVSELVAGSLTNPLSRIGIAPYESA